MVAGFSGNGKAQVHILPQVSSLLAERHLGTLKTELVEAPIGGEPSGPIDRILLSEVPEVDLHARTLLSTLKPHRHVGQK